MSKIIKVLGREILDSRGNPTLEVDVITEKGSLGRGAVPSGASTGLHEAHELRDEEPDRFLGKGVSKALTHLRDELAPKILGQDCAEQEAIDRLMISLDGTENKKRLGANSILGLSMACAQAAAKDRGVSLFQSLASHSHFKIPVPLMNVLNGGAHANNGLDVQEFMIVPLRESFSDSLRAGSEIFQHLKKILSERSLSTAVGDEGGFAPKLKSNVEAVELLLQAIEKAGYRPGEDVFLALDVAATELFDDQGYLWEGERISAEALLEIYASWAKQYPFVSIEDAYAEDDWAAWKMMTEKMRKQLQLVGDDLFVTNTRRLQQGFDQGAANSLLVKVNQIGTLTETREAVSMAQENGYQTVMSHRSGETEDTLIADLAVALNCSQIKTGSACRGERTAKYNQLLRIEEELGGSAQFWGRAAFPFLS